MRVWDSGVSEYGSLLKTDFMTPTPPHPDGLASNPSTLFSIVDLIFLVIFLVIMCLVKIILFVQPQIII